jgi:hypothetical protein
MVHSHKKSKGSTGSSTVSPVAISHPHLSPQRKGVTNKRASVHSPRQFPPKTFSSSESSASLSLSDGILTIGDDSDNKEDNVEVVDTLDTVSVQRSIRAGPQGGCRYGNPPQHRCTTSSLNSSGCSHDNDHSSALSKEEVAIMIAVGQVKVRVTFWSTLLKGYSVRRQQLFPALLLLVN